MRTLLEAKEVTKIYGKPGKKPGRAIWHCITA